MTQTIQIKRHGNATDLIDANVLGAFAIHETIPIGLGGWTLSHIPTGWAVLQSKSRICCRRARAELLASGLDWSFTDPKALTDEHKRMGKALRKKYGHDA